ncbi:hypothetical protein TNCV_4300741 [Trichonephila clavipes]|nr:hypothetical protein TNCV_4300741 [Trichonephila clavipes]
MGVLRAKRCLARFLNLTTTLSHDKNIKEFDTDMEKFRKKIGELDGRLGSVIKGCILDCSNVESMTKATYPVNKQSKEEVAYAGLNRSLEQSLRHVGVHYPAER